MRLVFWKWTSVASICTWTLWLLFIFEGIPTGLGAVKSRECDRKKGKCPAKAAKPPRTASFDDWANWTTIFPNCNPEHNEFLSPINIETSKAIPIKEQTLIIYSGDPVDVYTYSSLYRLEHDDVSIEALNIGLRNKEVYRDATYIAGLGNPEFRFFQRALILFSKQEIEPERSVHQIDGKKFPMEIVFFFEDLQKTDQTQIHVLFEISDTNGPAWFWNGEATTQLNQLLASVGTDNVKKDYVEAKHKYGESKKILDAKLEKQKNATDTYAEQYADLVLLHKLVASAEDTGKQEKVRKELVKKIKLTKTIVTELRDETPLMEERLQVAINTVERQKFAGELQRGQENAATDLVSELKEKKAEHAKLLFKSVDKIRTYENKKHDLDNDINGKRALLKQYKIGKNGTFKNVKDVEKKRKSMEVKLKELNTLQEKVTGLFNEMETLGAMEPRDVIIPQKFQISWFFPAIGGYYRYNGSGVVPPCRPRTHVIVMEKSVQILDVVFNEFLANVNKGRTQAEVDSFTGNILTDLPKIDRIIPVLRELGDRKIWYNRKNLQFKLDDGWHMMSSVRRRLKDQMRHSGRPPPAYQLEYKLMFISISFGVFIFS